jgi:hypothetical protein
VDAVALATLPTSGSAVADATVAGSVSAPSLAQTAMESAAEGGASVEPVLGDAEAGSGMTAAPGVTTDAAVATPVEPAPSEPPAPELPEDLIALAEVLIGR